jgi:trehalose-6-phosphatase
VTPLTGRVDDVERASIGISPGSSAGGLPAALIGALEEFAARAQVLVALDFDGVLAPIVGDPDDARPLPDAVQAVHRLAAGTGVRLALVSGRTLADLRRLADPPGGALLVGSHGAQFAGPPGYDIPEAECSASDRSASDRSASDRSASDGPEVESLPEDVVPGMDEQTQALLARVTSALDRISARHPGTFVERKPAGAVLHTRQAPRNAARRATEEALSGPSTWPGVHLTRGKEVIDLSVVDANKGVALSGLRTRLGLAPRGGGVLYVGDDVTDERAFAVLDDDCGDVTVKVGEGTTIARHRIDDPAAVATLLTRLADLRGC